MHIYLGNSPEIMVQQLHRLMAMSLHQFEIGSLRRVSSSIEVFAGAGSLPVATPFAPYTIFPPRIMRHLTQWTYEQRKMQPGDTIVQQILLPPVEGGVFTIICGVRITDVFCTANTAGFSYTTLEGHVEQGLSTFSFEGVGKDAVFKIETWSRPALPGGAILAPLFANRYQAWCTRQALAHVRAQLAVQ